MMRGVETTLDIDDELLVREGHRFTDLRASRLRRHSSPDTL